MCLNEIRGVQYLLDGYCTLGEPEYLFRNGTRYTIHRFQGEHKNEYLLHSEKGDMLLFENNILKQKWKEDNNGIKSDEFIAYKNGRVDFRQKFEDIYQQRDFCCFINHEQGLRMEIRSAKTGHLMYHGKCNKKYQKHGWGIEYSEKSGQVILEGIWSNGKLIEVIRLFNGDTMTELKRNGKDSLDPVKRIPIYVGGFRYDEDTEAFIREGKGCLINASRGTATRECEWKDGKEVSRIELVDGWYNPTSKFVIPTVTVQKAASEHDLESLCKCDPELTVKYVSEPPSKLSSESVVTSSKDHAPKCITRSGLKATIDKSQEMDSLSLQVEDLIISSNCCNDLNALDLSKFSCLQSVEIGNSSFALVKTFRIDGLRKLKSLTIGIDSFTQVKQSKWEDGWNKVYKKANNRSKSFHIVNCESLKSIEIGRYSFSDFAGDFELKNLNLLQSIKIGEIGKMSSNFWWSSFVVRGIGMILIDECVDLPHLQNIILGNCVFCLSLTTIIQGIDYE